MYYSIGNYSTCLHVPHTFQKRNVNTSGRKVMTMRTGFPHGEMNRLCRSCELACNMNLPAFTLFHLNSYFEIYFIKTYMIKEVLYSFEWSVSCINFLVLQYSKYLEYSEGTRFHHYVYMCAICVCVYTCMVGDVYIQMIPRIRFPFHCTVFLALHVIFTCQLYGNASDDSMLSVLLIAWLNIDVLAAAGISVWGLECTGR